MPLIIQTTATSRFVLHNISSPSAFRKWSPHLRWVTRSPCSHPAPPPAHTDPWGSGARGPQRCSGGSEKTGHLLRHKIMWPSQLKLWSSIPGDLWGSGGLRLCICRESRKLLGESWADSGLGPAPPSWHHSCLISSRRFFISALYSDTRSFLPSTMHVLLGRGRYLETEGC